MAPRRSARTKHPKPTLGKTKVAKKPTTKKFTTIAKKTHKKTLTEKAAPMATTNRKLTTKNTTKSISKTTTKNFPCACIQACLFKSAKTDLRFVLGRPEYGEITANVCTCKVHYKCAKHWASAHNELPSVLPCGCPITTRGANFWAWGVPGRKAELKKKEDQRKQAEQKKKQELWEDFDWGSDLTDLED